jgi:hypothetical protein
MPDRLRSRKVASKNPVPVIHGPGAVSRQARKEADRQAVSPSADGFSAVATAFGFGIGIGIVRTDTGLLLDGRHGQKLAKQEQSYLE